MAEDSSRTPGRGRVRHRRGTASAGGADGERCSMCGATVPIDDRGRCPLGHPVRTPADADGVVASYAEPTPPSPPPPVAEVQAMPSAWTGAWDAGPVTTPEPVGPAEPEPAELPLRIPDRLRLPLDRQLAAQPQVEAEPQPEEQPEAQPDVADDREPAEGASPGAAPPAEQPTASGASEPHAGPVVRTWPTVRVEPPPSVLGEPAAPSSGAVVAVTDLSPDAPSALDGVPPAGGTATAHDDPAYEQEPIEDEADHEPPRGWLERIAAGLFVLALVAVAWYLAMNL